MLTQEVTFLFTDIEGSARHWELDPEAMRAALARHDETLRGIIECRGGSVFKTLGDAFCAAFDSPAAAVTAACEIQRRMKTETWETSEPLRVRIAVHTGEAEARGADYFGRTLNRVARLMAIAHGGQTVLSGAARERVEHNLPTDVTLTDLGQHRLKDLSEPERVFQLDHPDLPSEFPPLMSLESFPNNLPQQLTTFIGRERELEQVKGLLAETRLLTLTGAGGSGKTRLALQVAADLLADYTDGVWFVELAALADADLVPETVASTLHLRQMAGQSALEALTSYFAAKTALLIFDNCEHLVEACASVAEALLRACPEVRILATSREALRIGGEQTWRVPSLTLPDPAKRYTASALLESEANRLFVDRAGLSRAAFRPTDQNAPAIALICRRLDGIPLAIELAAARCKVLSPQQIAERLDDRFRLLAGGSRTALPRQQTLRAAIDWSYDLLSAAEATLFQRLSVFRGGWTLDAAEAVCAGDGVDELAVLDLLANLVDKSLVLVDESTSPEVRYSFLESIRSYTAERLEELEEIRALRIRHRDWYLGFAEEAKARLDGPDQAEWLGRVEREMGNLRAALGCCLEEGGEEGLRMAGALCRFWYIRGHYAEGQDWLLRAMESGRDAPPELRAQALYALGICANEQGDYEAARSRFRLSHDLNEEIGDKDGVARSLNALGIVADRRGDYQAAKELYEEALAMNRELGNELAEARVLNNLGIVARKLGDLALAQELYERALRISRSTGSRAEEALNLNNLGNVILNQGDLDAARSLFERALEISREVGNRAAEALNLENLGQVAFKSNDLAAAASVQRQALALRQELGDKLGIAFSMEALARIDFAEGNRERAASLLAAAAALRAEIGSPPEPQEHEELGRMVADLKAALGAKAFDAAWQAARALPLEEAVHLALGS
jgi:predicted ATPase/class 3 adenylate cyclase